MEPMGAVNFPPDPLLELHAHKGVVVTIHNVPIHFTGDPSKAGSVLVTVLVLFRNGSESL